MRFHKIFEISEKYEFFNFFKYWSNKCFRSSLTSNKKGRLELGLTGFFRTIFKKLKISIFFRKKGSTRNEEFKKAIQNHFLIYRVLLVKFLAKIEKKRFI